MTQTTKYTDDELIQFLENALKDHAPLCIGCPMEDVHTQLIERINLTRGFDAKN